MIPVKDSIAIEVGRTVAALAPVLMSLMPPSIRKYTGAKGCEEEVGVQLSGEPLRVQPPKTAGIDCERASASGAAISSHATTIEIKNLFMVYLSALPQSSAIGMRSTKDRPERPRRRTSASASLLGR